MFRFIILENKHSANTGSFFFDKYSANTNSCALQFQYFLKDPVKYDVKYQVSSFIELQLFKDFLKFKLANKAIS